VGLDLAMDLVVLVKVLHIIHRLKYATSYQVVALTAFVLVRCVCLGELDVVLPVLHI